MAFTKDSKLGFIGAGRVGKALALALHQQGYTVASAASRTFASAEALAKLVPGCTAYPTVDEAAEAADFVFITSTDDSIGLVASGTSWRPGQGVVHCSGSASLDALEGAARQGAEIGALHPLQAFTTVENSVKSLPGSTFAIEGDDEMRSFLTEMALALGGNPIFLKSEDKPLYHACVVMMGGIFMSFAGAVAGIWKHLGIEPNDALKSLVPITQGACVTLESVGVPDGLAGPYVRGDVGTVKKHVNAVRSFAPHMLLAYCHTALAGLDLAFEKGQVPEERAQEIRQILESAARSS
jgi:predicted short-subunit dehydrogenase-like oxidoreductase (DUF2520 family)